MSRVGETGSILKSWWGSLLSLSSVVGSGDYLRPTTYDFVLMHG